MNFEGRYYTENETLVAVHLLPRVPRECQTSFLFYGHTIPKETTTIMYWNSQGHCVAINGAIVEGMEKFNLIRRVNPMTYAHSMKVEWCEECKEGK